MVRQVHVTAVTYTLQDVSSFLGAAKWDHLPYVIDKINAIYTQKISKEDGGVPKLQTLLPSHACIACAATRVPFTATCSNDLRLSPPKTASKTHPHRTTARPAGVASLT